MAAPLLRVDDLRIRFSGGAAPIEGVEVVHGVSFTLGAGESLGLVGESGAGKSLTALSVAGLLPPAARATGRVLLGDREVLTASPAELRAVRGARVGFVFQEPQTSLNPVLPIGLQVAEAVRAHRRDIDRAAAKRRALELLDRVALADAARRYGSYPHQLSGGQRQRVVLAAALAGEPELLVADEPTTALDVTVQAQILELLDGLRRELGLALLLITHDLAVVARICERVAVLYAGRIVERAPTAQLFARPAHPYTRALLAAAPRLGSTGDSLESLPGSMPPAGDLPPGCAFHPRCPEVLPICPSAVPLPTAVGAGEVCCYLHSGDASLGAELS